MRCKFCKSPFTTSIKQTGRQIYCSKQCRERAWRKNNLKYALEYQKKYRKQQLLANPKYCQICKQKLTLEARSIFNGMFCSQRCRSISIENRRIRTNIKNNAKRKKTTSDFHKYKENIGCAHCGYNKYGGSLDFHHVDPSKKKRRISATHWISNSDIIKKEIEKCVLLCKNCHYEEHSRLKKI